MFTQKIIKTRLLQQYNSKDVETMQKSIYWWKGLQNKILFSHLKGMVYWNMLKHESWKCYAKPQKHKRLPIVWLSLYEIFRIGKSIVASLGRNGMDNGWQGLGWGRKSEGEIRVEHNY